jgi:RIO kinase 1
MRVPPSLEPLLEMGIIDEVFRPLLSGKEAAVYLVGSNGHPAVAKVYKQAEQRSFKNRADYTEGRRGRNTRQERAKGRGSKYGRAEEESAWRSAEVDAIYRLKAAGVRVPEPYHFVDGVLVMELVADADGNPAPRLVDVDLLPDEATEIYFGLLREVQKMLCAGLVHGDLSDFNVLLAADGPVVIDFPQAIDAAANRNAGRILVRDVDNLTSFLSRWVPDLRGLPYGQEMWALYERGELTPDTVLTGKVKRSSHKSDLRALVDEIAHAAREEARRREHDGRKPLREIELAQSAAPPRRDERPAPGRNPQRPSPPRPAPASEPDPFDDLDALLSAD